MSLQIDIAKTFKNFSLQINFESTESTLGILGGSGCGKSMTLKAIAGIITPDRGRIVLNGKVLFDSEKKINLPPQERKVGYLFQSYALFPHMTVIRNIETGLHVSKKLKDEKIKEMITMFGLEGLEHQYPSQLSGGQQQRVALARIMSSDVDILLLDEPFSALDYYLKELLQEQLMETIRNYKKDVVLVTHDRNEVFTLCSQLAVMDHGSLICKGNVKEIFKNPRYLEAAKLTGCKNFSRVKRVSDYEVYAIDWNINLRVLEKVPQDISYVGIRAHYLEKGTEEKSSKENRIQPELVEVMESPFEMNLIVKNKDVLEGHSRDLMNDSKMEPGKEKIWWKISKDYWYQELKCQLPEYLSFPPQDIMLLRDENDR